MTIWHEERLLIDGELVDAEGGRTYENESPSTEEVLGVVADASLGDVRRAIAAARRAFDETDWSTNTELRQRCLRQLHQAMLDNRDKLADILVHEVGAPVQLMGGPQLDGPISVLGWHADLLDTYEWTEDLGTREAFGSQHRRWVEKEAAGVAACIVAYNYPIQLAIAKLAPALAAGCTVVLKGAPQTPWAATALGNLIAEHTDIPAGVVNVITSSEAEVSAELTRHADVDVVSFTGSTPVGRAIAAAAAPTIKRVFLELGGKSACILLDDGDPAVAAMVAAFATASHSGQGCAITSRLLVPRERYDEVVALCAEFMTQVSVGDPTDPAVYMGPLISAAQREKVEAIVDRAVAEGAKAVVGGRRPEALTKGYYYEPTMLTGVDENAEVAQDELFGPVLVVLPHDGDDDAVRIANNSIFGLSAMILSADDERATRVARRIRSGTVGVNGGVWYAPDAPFGGYKQSGIGREMGVAGLDEFLEKKTLAIPVA